eukprot:jgi/Galph1/4536/GphlegSOOS_G3183.1
MSGDELGGEPAGSVLDNLPQSKKDSVETFRTVTQCESIQEAIEKLESVDWNLDRAVDMYLSGESFPGARQASVAENGFTGIEGTTSEVDSPLVPTTRRQTGFTSQASTLFQMTVSFFLAPIKALLKAASSLLRLFFVGPQSIGRPRIEVARQATRDFVQQFETKAHLKFVLVYLHADRHYLTPDFCRDVLTNEQVISFINENFIFWASSVTSPEGRHLQVSFRATDFPFLAVVYVTHERRAAQMLETKYGPMEADEVMEFLVQSLDRHGNILTNARLEQERHLETRQIRQEQDAAFQRAVEEDMARLRAVEEAEAARKEEKARIEREKQEAELLEQRIQKRRRMKQAQMEEEPPKGDQVFSIAVRQADGNRFERRFKRQDMLRQVFDWVDINGIDIEKINLVCNFPKRSFDYDRDGYIKLEEIDRGPHLVFFIEDK